MKISKEGIDLIKEFEGFSPKVYLDQAGLPTIGYGTLIDSPEEEQYMKLIISEEMATNLLLKDVKVKEDAVNRYVKKNINQRQFDALVCFAYNVGSGNFRRSTLLKLVNQDPNNIAIGEQFQKWVYADGKVSKGLQRRRLAEWELYSRK